MVSLGKATTGVMWKWVIGITIMDNSFNTFNAVIRSREMEPLFMVLDGVSLFIIRQSKYSPMLSISLSHSHSPLTYAQRVVPTEYSEKMETLPKSQLQNSNSGGYLSITGLQWLLGQMAQMMVGILWTVIIWCSRELLSWEVMGRTSETGFRDQVSRLQSGGQKKQVVCYPIPISRAMWPSQVTFLPVAVLFFKEAKDNNRINFIELWELLGKITTYQYTMNMWQRFYVTY